MRRVLTLFALLFGAASAASASSVVWSSGTHTAGWPNYNGYISSQLFTPVSHKTMIYMSSQSNSGIYSTNVFGYDPSNNSVTVGTGTNSSGAGQCPLDTPSIPGDRHPMVVATDAHHYWLTGGPNQICSGTGGDGSPRVDLYYWTDSSNFSASTWTKVNIATTTFPTGISLTYAESWVWESYYNVLFLWGHDGGGESHTTWIYCSTLDNGGVLTSSQTAAGCTSPDAWIEVTGWTCSGTHCNGNQPPGVIFPYLVDDPINHKVLQFSGQPNPNPGQIFENYTFSYDLPSKTWTEKCTGGCTNPPAETNAGSNPWSFAVAYNTTDKKFYYHYERGPTAPSDWTYDSVVDTWTEFQAGTGYNAATRNGGTGSNATDQANMSYDSVNNDLILTSQGTSGSGDLDIWIGSVSSVTVAVPIATMTVQEALFQGGPNGVTRSSEAFCQGMPLADSLGITSDQQFSLSGALDAQFKSEATWPSGHMKWVKICATVPSLIAGSTATLILQNNGTGNTGPGMAVQGSTTIVVNTSTATFTIRASSFNVLDSVDVGNTHVLLSTTSPTRGLIIMGPDPTQSFPANVTCGTGTGASACATLYSTSYDSNSTCAIEENGPAVAVVKCNGTFYSSGHKPYMHFTVREYFSKYKSSVKITTILRNADYSTEASPSTDCNFSGGQCNGLTFNSAYKGMLSYEMRLAPNITGTLTYTIANDSTTTSTGNLSQAGGTDDAYIYQGYANYMSDPAGFCANTSCQLNYTHDDGYVIRKNTITTSTGTNTHVAGGWADISDASGKGMEMGIYQMSAYYPKSLEFASGGADARIGLLPSENGNPNGGPGNGTFYQYQQWPAWNTSDVFLEFHASTPTSYNDEFTKFQQYLVAHATFSYYNTTGVFPYQLADPNEEDAYMINAINTSTPTVSPSLLCYYTGGPCVPDLGVSDPGLMTNNYTVAMYRYFYWGNPGARTQEEFRWSDMLMFMKRGYTGRYVNSSQFYRFQEDNVYDHFDGTKADGTDAVVNHGELTGGWRSRPPSELGTGYNWPYILGGGCADGESPSSPGCPRIQNSTHAFVNYPDGPHAHDYGFGDWILNSGDQSEADAYVARKDFYLSTTSYMGGDYQTNNGGVWYIRTLGIYLLGIARTATYLTSIGDSVSASSMTANAVKQYMAQVVPDLCVGDGAGNTYPTGCLLPPTTAYSAGGYDPPGVSRTRGAAWTPESRGQGWCIYDNNSTYLRWYQPFTYGLYVEGLMALRLLKGSGWGEYERILDLAYGVSSWMLSEVYRDNGGTNWYDTPNTGLRSSGGQALFNGFSSAIPIDLPAQCNAPNGPGGIVTSSGTLATDGTTGNIVGSGTAFNSLWAHSSLWIGSNPYPISVITDATHLTVTVSPNTGTLPPANPTNAYSCCDYGHGLMVRLNNITYDPYDFATATQGMYMLFYPQILMNGSLNSTQQRKLKLAFQNEGGYNGNIGSVLDIGQYQTSLLINSVNHPPAQQLKDVPFSFQDLGSGNYKLSWNEPSGTLSYRVKWGTHTIVNSGGFSTISPSQAEGLLGYETQNTQAFALSPSTYTPWFGTVAVGVSSEPVPGTASQNITLTTGQTGLLSPEFSVKAFTSGSTTVGPAANLTYVSGNSQSGTVNSTLSAPFFAVVTDSNSFAVSGTTVVWAVTGGGGSLSGTNSISDVNGLVSTTLTLGSSAGTNTVTCSSSTLTGSPVTFTATATGGGGGGSFAIRKWIGNFILKGSYLLL